MTSFDVSVILCTYNRAEMLREALQSLVQLETDGSFAFEIVVIDNASTDATPQAVAEIAAQSPVTVRQIYEPNAGVSHARNRGVAEAHGEWLAFFDDDQLAEPDWLLRLLELAREEEVACVGGAVHLQFVPETSRKLGDMVRVMLGEVAEPRPRDYGRTFAPGTGNLMLHRSVFDAVGNFRTDLAEAGEDTDLFQRIRAERIRGCYTPQAVVQHMTPQYRIEAKYLRWTARRIGSHIARREHQDYGILFFASVVMLRIAQGWLKFAPQVAIARLAGNEESLLNARCRWWLSEGYASFARKRLLPAWLTADGLIGDLVFRNERDMQREN